ncbi:MAG: hypothetical protein ACI4SE_07665 [Lachnospiraceae bacterium]
MKLKEWKIIAVLLILMLTGCTANGRAEFEQSDESASGNAEPTEDVTEQQTLEKDTEDESGQEEEQVSTENFDEVTDYETAIRLYEEFLNGEITIETKYAVVNMDSITIPTGEPENRYRTKYTYWDSDEDNVPELHIKSARYYYIFSCRNDELIIWQRPDIYDEPINNGTFIYHRPGGAPGYDDYSIYTYNESGEEEYQYRFSRYDSNENYEYDEGDEFLFNDELVTYEEWRRLTALWLDENGNVLESISDEIEWIMLYE